MQVNPSTANCLVYENSLKENIFGPEEGLMGKGVIDDLSFLSTLATDAASQLDVLGHDCHTLGMDSTQVGILKQTHQVGLGSFLECHDSRGLEAKVSLEILSNLTHQALERQLPDQQFGALLVTADLTESHGTRPVTVGLLHTSSDLRAAFVASCLRGALPPVDLRAVCFVRAIVAVSDDDATHTQLSLSTPVVGSFIMRLGATMLLCDWPETFTVVHSPHSLTHPPNHNPLPSNILSLSRYSSI